LIYKAQIQGELYHLDDSVRNTIQKSDDGIAGDRKFIVFLASAANFVSTVP